MKAKNYNPKKKKQEIIIKKLFEFWSAENYKKVYKRISNLNSGWQELMI